VPAGLGTIVDVSCGGAHTCAVDDAGRVTCWGDSFSGQSTVAAGLGTIVAVTTGRNHTCVLDDAGGVSCWGSNDQNQSIY
jgi:alpha-tubulin suppressor-like RCC1 family protein